VPQATFRVLVFRPFCGEVLVGRITHAHPCGPARPARCGAAGVSACAPAVPAGRGVRAAPVPALRETLPRARRQGLQVSLGFFDDVHIAPDFLPEPSMFEPGDKGGGEWFWQYDDNRMYLERNEPVRVRVREARLAPPPTLPYPTVRRPAPRPT